MGLIVFISIILIILVIKVSDNRKAMKEDEKIINFLSLSRHNATDIREIADTEYELRLKLAVSEIEYEGGRISEEDHIQTIKTCLMLREILFKKYQTNEFEVEKYYNFVYSDKK